MSDSAIPEAVAEQTEDESQVCDFAAWRECDVLYGNWLAARAALFDPDMPEDAAILTERSDKHDAAARALLVRPSVLSWMIWRKWEVLDDLVTNEKENGPRVDNLMIAALGCIKADLLRFGLKDPE